MALFDAVKTEVADAVVVKASTADHKIKLDLRPVEELKELEEKTRANFGMHRCFRSRTALNYLFLKHLREQKHKQFAEFLEAMGPYSEASQAARKKQAKALRADYLVPKKDQESGKPEKPPKEVGEVEVVCRSSEPCSAAAAAPADDREADMSVWATAEHPDEVRKIEKQLEDAPLELWAGLCKHLEEYFKKHLEESFLASEHFKKHVQLVDYATKPAKLEDFHVFRVLGRGAFGAVSAVQKKDTCKMYALKEMNKKMVKKNGGEKLTINEQNILRMLNSPFVLKLSFSFQNKTSLFLVFQMFNGGDLKFYIRKTRKTKPAGFSNDRCCFYTAEILLGLEQMHSKNIIYRDLKPENIMLAASGHVGVVDLGLAVKVDPEKGLKAVAGTPCYWAPEVLSEQGTFPASDYWSLGVVLYEMATGFRPYVKVDKTKKEWSPFRADEFNTNCAKETDSTFKPFTKYDKRLTPECVNLLEKLFEPDPKKRLGANGVQEIKDHPYFKDIDWDALASLETPPPFKPDENTVNAESIESVGTFDQNELKKIKITPEDEEKYKKFGYTSSTAVQHGLVHALKRMDEQAAEDAKQENNKAVGGCCTLL